MNAQELFNAFHDVDPSWLKEADLLADRAAEQISAHETMNAPENEIQQIFAQHSENKARAVSQVDNVLRPDRKAPAFPDLTGTSSGLTAAQPEPVKGSRGFRMLGGLAAAVALISIGAFGVSVFGGRNSAEIAQPAAQITEEQSVSEQKDYGLVEVYDDDGKLIAASRADIDYQILYQDLDLAYHELELHDDKPVITSGYITADIHQPAGTPVELTLKPNSKNLFLAGSEYRIIAQQGDKVLEITDMESNQTAADFVFTTTDNYEDNCKTISFMPDDTNDGSEIKIWMIVKALDEKYNHSWSSTVRFFSEEPGSPNTYSNVQKNCMFSSEYFLSDDLE